MNKIKKYKKTRITQNDYHLPYQIVSSSYCSECGNKENEYTFVVCYYNSCGTLLQYFEYMLKKQL